MDINLYKIIIGAYVHDIGKIFQRGGFYRSKNTNIDFAKGTIGDYEIAHAQLVRDYFFGIPTNDGIKLSGTSKHKDMVFKNDFWKEIGLIASLHHGKDFSSYKHELTNEQQQLARIINMADNFSALERHDDIQEDDSSQINYINTTGLTTIFANIFEDDKSNTYKYEPEELNSGDLYPSKLSSKVNFEKICKDFREQFSLLIEEYQDISESDSVEKFNLLVAKLDILFQNYTTFIPSSAYHTDIVDISLYDHVKTTVGFATTLYLNYQQQGMHTIKTSWDTNKIKQEFITVIAGDFPSIQQYIFGGVKKSTYLSKRLRARSLRVQLLNEAVVQYLLDKIGLSRANVLINAGGKFVILAPAGIKIEGYRGEINQFLLNTFGGNIKFSLIDHQYTIGDIAGKGEQNKHIFQNIFEELSHNKFQCYDENNLKAMFQQQDVGGKILCKYCGQNYFETEHDENYEASEDHQKDDMCECCQKEITIGEQIVKESIQEISLIYKDENGFKYEEIIENTDEKKIEDTDGHLKILVNDRSYQKLGNNFGIVKSINLYVPKDNGKTKDFEKLANKNGYLCMLKGDVDAMSLIFKCGFGQQYSISRLVQFSRFMELFFGKYLHQKLAKYFPNVYTVFSGGDDFVFVVPFDERKSFVQGLYKEFKRFVGENQYLHFSIGLGIFKHKTPFKQVDEYTEELLKSAKKKSKEITLFDEKGEKIDIQKNDTEELAKKYEKEIKTHLPRYAMCFYEKEFVKIYGEKISGIINTEFNPNDLALQRSLDDDKSSMLYKVYTTLKEMRQDLECEMPRWSDFVLKGARLLYMIRRNATSEQFVTIQKELAFLNKISQKELIDKKEQINTLLLKLVDKIYENR